MWGRLVSAVVILAIVAAAVWALWPKPIVVEVASIGRHDLEVTVEEEGTTRIREIFQVSAPVAGNLSRVELHPGDALTAGQTIASIRPAGPGLLDDRSRRIAQTSIDAAAAAVDLARATLSQAEAQQGFAAADLERTNSLASRGLVSTKIEQQATLQAAMAETNVEAARATLLMRQQELERAQAAMIEGEGGADQSLCCVEVRAPEAGQVLAVHTESEQVVHPGAPLVDVGDPRDLEVIVNVLSSDAVRMSVGSPATVEGWGGDPLPAEVTRIEPVASTHVSALGVEEQRTRVSLAFTGPPETRARLGHGFHVIARIVVWQGKDLVAVPMGSLFRQGETWAVYVVDGDKAVARQVSIGQRNADYAVVESGLEAGDTVIVHPGDTIADGVAVTTRAR